MADVSNTIEIVSLFEKYNIDVCIGAVPSFLQYKVTAAASQYGNCHYFDLGASQECLDQQKGLGETFRQNQKVVMPFCGFDPGMLNMLLLSCVKHIDCDGVTVYVGGIAETKPENRFVHYWTFNPESTLETYRGNVSAIQNSKLVTVNALEGYVNLNIGLHYYEAFFTNCGNKEVMEDISKTATHLKTCEIKTARHVGHWNMARFLAENGFLENKMLSIIAEQLTTSVPFAENDIAFLEMRFLKKEKKIGAISWMEKGSQKTTTAMQKVTAKSAALTIFFVLAYSSLPPLSGFMMPEILASKVLHLTPKKIIEKMQEIGLSISSTLP